MESSNTPVPKNLAKLEKMAKKILNTPVDFSNTEIAFRWKTDKELKKAAWLFGMMNNHWLVGIGSKVGITAIKMHLPFVESVVKNTIFEQFCGGTTLLESLKSINKLAEQNVHTILDYGAEAKETEEDFNKTMAENIRAIEFAAQHPHIQTISTKITGLARFELLEAIQRDDSLTREMRAEYRTVLKRLDAICYIASQKGVGVFIDAEETWIQDAIDHLTNLMMRRYNREKVVVFNTFQMYRSDRLQFLIDSYDDARREGYMLGAKLVRGAYMEKERDRAEKMGYPSPIHASKEMTDDAFNTGIRFCLDHYEDIAFCNASHNVTSAALQLQLMEERGVARNHPHVQFCQLYGMSDNMTFNLADAGYNASKYLVYGQVREVLPYLIRRAEENTSITGDMSREYQLVNSELKRRELAG